MTNSQIPQIPPPRPTPLAGMQGPGAEGTGNLLDPAVRAELREVLQDVVGDTLKQILGDLLGRFRGAQGQAPIPAPLQGAAPEVGPPAAGVDQGPVPKPAEAPAAGNHHGFPFAHGDVDLSSLPLNVPTAEERRPRRGGQRQFYFLED